MDIVAFDPTVRRELTPPRLRHVFAGFPALAVSRQPANLTGGYRLWLVTHKERRGTAGVASEASTICTGNRNR